MCLGEGDTLDRLIDKNRYSYKNKRISEVNKSRRELDEKNTHRYI